MLETWLYFFFVFLFTPMLLVRIIRSVLHWLGALV